MDPSRSKAQPTPSGQGPSQREAIAHDDKPTLHEILSFKGNIDIPQMIGSSYYNLGIFLLNDDTGAKTNALEIKNLKDPYRMNLDVFREWLKGSGAQPVTWRTLVITLKKMQLLSLAEEIEEELGRQTGIDNVPESHSANNQRPAVPLVQPNQQVRHESGEDETDSPAEEPRFPEKHKGNIAKEKRPDPEDTVKHEAVIKNSAKDIKIIIQCCNENEYYACLDRMEPPITGPTGEKMFNRSVLYPFGDDEDGYPTIVLGMFAKRKAAIVWTKQASRCEADLKVACDRFPNSKAIIAVGVCYGIDRKTVEFCDVLVSSQIVDLSVTKNDEERPIYQNEGGIHITNRTLQNIFCIDSVGWEFACVEKPEKRKSKAFVGQVLSGPFRLNSKEKKEQLIKEFKDAKGGEMEGCVLYTKDIADRCIVIKGVSDYADGKKDKKWQLTAAMAAADYTHYMLEKSPVFR